MTGIDLQLYQLILIIICSMLFGWLLGRVIWKKHDRNYCSALADVQSEQEKLKHALQNKEIVIEENDFVLKTILDTIPCQVFIKDVRDNFKYKIASKNFLDYYKLSLTEVIDQDDYVIFGEEVANELRQNDTKVVEHCGKHFTFDENISSRFSKEDVFKSLKTCFVTEFGHPYLLGVCVDVTDLDKMQKNLARAVENEHLLNELMTRVTPENNNPSSYLEMLKQFCEYMKADRCYLLRYSEDLKYTEVFGEYSAISSNRRLLKNGFIYDTPIEDQLMRNISDGRISIIHHDDDLNKFFHPDSIWRKEYLKIGMKSLYALPIMLDGKIWGNFGVAFEQEKVVLDSSQLGSLESFGHMVEILLFRKNYLDRLANALENAQAASRAKSAFLATMSHELRTPLNSVIGFSELLNGPDVSPETQKEYIHDINVSGKALLSLINDILDLSKIEADQMKIVPRPLDLKHLFMELESIFNSSALSCNLYLNFILPEDFPVIMVDELRLRQILLNLIGNALKFTNHGGVSVDVKYENATLTLNVRDTGIGIAPEFLQEIFQPFVQQDTVRDSQNKHGSGLGLAICYKLAQKMGGDLKVVSQPGEGSCFTLILHNIIKAPEIQPRVRHKTVFVDLKPENLQVLVVDDVPINLKVFQGMLKRIGITPQLAHSGKEALQLLENHEFNFLLTDMWMPEMNGTELVKKIRENPRFKNLQTVLLSADTTLSKEEKDIFDTVLMKPITLKKLHNFFKNSCGIE